MTKNKTNPKIVFFGTPEISVIVLNELKRAGLTPALVVTMPDKPKGRKFVLTPSPVKVWAQENKIDFVQPAKLDESFLELLRSGGFDLFVVASYGKILKQELLDIPKYGTLNVHPSLLPKLRGASPIISAILKDEKNTGVTIILLDAGMDSGPILAQKSIGSDLWPASRGFSEGWPPKASELGELLMREGGKMLAEIIPRWIAGEIKPEAQDHAKATFTKKINKEDGLIELNKGPLPAACLSVRQGRQAYQNLLKIRAFAEWPGTYFFADKNTNSASRRIRVKITDAELDGDKLKINKVIPEGRKEMNYEDFLRG